MKYEFQVEDAVEARVMRTMIMRGFYAFKEDLDEEHKRHERNVLQVQADPKVLGEEEKRHAATIEKLQKEGELWKQLLLTFTQVSA